VPAADQCADYQPNFVRISHTHFFQERLCVATKRC
jgi:hypothetical protein